MFKVKPVDNAPKKIIFEKFNHDTQSFDPDGTLAWNGKEWTVEKDNQYNSMAVKLMYPKYVGRNEYTKNDRDFYRPLYHLPTTGTRVTVK